MIQIFLLTIIALNQPINTQTDVSIYFQYYDINLISNTVIVYQNSSVSSQFYDSQNQFSCANGFLFTYNQTDFQFVTKTPYNLSFFGINNNFNVTISSKFNVVNPIPAFQQCFSNPCNISIRNNCILDSDSDQFYVSVSPVDNQQIRFIYNVICDRDKLVNPIEYGKIILAFISLLMIFPASKFQAAKSFKNSAHYINQYTIIIYNLFVLVSSVLVIINAPGTNATISYICLLLSVFLGIGGMTVCVSQFCYWLNIKSLRASKCKIRLMDCIGVIFGICVMILWFVLGKSWIVGDIIFCFIFLATMKLVKFGSLKIAIITFTITMGTDIFFITLAWGINRIYYNNAILSIFNNTLFLMVPTLTHYPNRKCSWFFLASMLYPGLLQCYFQRFDSSRSSKIYTIIFFICYVVTMIVWIIINFYANFTFPYDLLVTPATLITVVLFANRRGQINQIWLGQFYDQVHKNANRKQLELGEVIKKQKSPSQISYERDLFNGLKFGDLNDTASIYQRGSNLTDIQPWKLQLKQQQQLSQLPHHPTQKQQKLIKEHLLQKTTPIDKDQPRQQTQKQQSQVQQKQANINKQKLIQNQNSNNQPKQQ